MPAEMGQKDFRMRIIQQFRIITISGNSPDRFVKCCLMLDHSEPIDKNEIRITIHLRDTYNTIFFLIPLFFHESFFYEFKYRNCSASGL